MRPDPKDHLEILKVEMSLLQGISISMMISFSEIEIEIGS